MSARPFLLVDDYPLQLAFRTLIKRRTGRDVVHVRTFHEAAELVQRPSTYCGLLLDVELSRDRGAPTGFDVLVLARRLEPRLPAAMLTGKLEVALIARATELGAFYVPKTSDVIETLQHFLRAALAYEGDGSLDAAVDRVLLQIGLDRERAAARVLRLHARGLSPEDVREHLDISLNTYKGFCRELRQISGRDRVLELVREVWREFLQAPK